MSGPQKFRKRPVVIEAMRLHAGTDPDVFLDPNTEAHARIAGWMHAHGFKDFNVQGDSRTSTSKATTAPTASPSTRSKA